MRECVGGAPEHGSRPVLWSSATLGVFAALLLLAPDAVSCFWHPYHEKRAARKS